jgi:hypothetical protein
MVITTTAESVGDGRRYLLMPCLASESSCGEKNNNGTKVKEVQGLG